MAFVEKHPHEKGFSIHFERHVENQLPGLRAQRAELLRQIQIRAWRAFSVIVFVTAMTGLAAWLIGMKFPILVAGGMALITLLGVAWYLSGPPDDYEERLRDVIMVAVTHFLGEARYRRVPDDDDVNIKPFEDAGILPFYTERKLRDQLSGKHRGLNYDSMDARLIYQVMGLRRVYFAGVLIALPAPINAPGTLRLVKGLDNLHRTMRDCFPETQRIDISGPLADAGFAAYSADPEIGRMIAASRDVQQLAVLPAMLGKAPVIAALRDNLLLLALARGTGRFEEASLFEDPALIPDTARKMLSDALLAVNVIDALITQTPPSDQ